MNHDAFNPATQFHQPGVRAHQRLLEKSGASPGATACYVPATDYLLLDIEQLGYLPAHAEYTASERAIFIEAYRRERIVQRLRYTCLHRVEAFKLEAELHNRNHNLFIQKAGSLMVINIHGKLTDIRQRHSRDTDRHYYDVVISHGARRNESGEILASDQHYCMLLILPSQQSIAPYIAMLRKHVSARFYLNGKRQLDPRKGPVYTTSMRIISIELSQP